MSTERAFNDWLEKISPVRRRGVTIRDVVKHAQIYGLDPHELDCPVRPEHKLRPMLAADGLVKCRECEYERSRRRRAKKPIQKSEN